MAKKISGPQLILANRLTDGMAVFFTGDDWSEDVRHAAVREGDDLEALAAKAAESDAANQVTSITRAEAELGPDGPRPLHIKIRMQTLGPSVRTDLGYQSRAAEEKA